MPEVFAVYNIVAFPATKPEPTTPLTLADLALASPVDIESDVILIPEPDEL